MEDSEEGQLLGGVNKSGFSQKCLVNGDDTEQPEDHRIAAVVAALCFFPTGLVSLYQSRKVQRLYREGDVIGSEWASRRTRQLVVLTRRVSLIFWLCALLLVAAGLVLGLCFAIDSNKR